MNNLLRISARFVDKSNDQSFYNNNDRFQGWSRKGDATSEMTQLKQAHGESRKGKRF